MKNIVNLKLTILLVLFSMLVGCAKEDISPEIPAQTFNMEEAERRWLELQESSPMLTPFKAEGSLRFGQEGKTQRVSYILWSNETNPVRLDIIYSLSPIAMIYEGKNDSILTQDDVKFFIPSEKTLYTHENTIVALNTLGIDIPFNLFTLRKIFQGVYPPSEEGYYYTNVDILANSNNYVYDVYYDINALLSQSAISSENVEIPDPFMGSWILDEFSRPVSFSSQGWELTFSYKDELRNPHKVSGTHVNTNVFTVFVNQSSVEPEYSKESFEINVPEDTQIIDL